MLPNSIERTTPILGYNPYAFIMGKSGSVSPGNMVRKNGQLDYFAKNPENMYTDGEKANKKFKITSNMKKIIGVAAGILGITALCKLKGSKGAKSLKGKISEQFTKFKDAFSKKP